MGRGGSSIRTRHYLYGSFRPRGDCTTSQSRYRRCSIETFSPAPQSHAESETLPGMDETCTKKLDQGQTPSIRMKKSRRSALSRLSLLIDVIVSAKCQIKYERSLNSFAAVSTHAIPTFSGKAPLENTGGNTPFRIIAPIAIGIEPLSVLSTCCMTAPRS